MDSYDAFTLDVTEGVARITLAQPERGNPFDATFCAEISRIAARIDEDRAIRCVLIDAAGRYFSVGADLNEFTRDRDEMRVFLKNATAGLHMAISRFARMDPPIVVAVHALAAGGSVALSAAADFCLAARSARFYAAYTGIGLLCDGGGSYYLPGRVGGRRATEFFLRNQMWSADEAESFGLVNRVVADDELPAEAWALARELAQGPTRALGEIKNLLLSATDQPLETQLELEARAMTRVMRTDDAWHGVCEVAAKRKPVFEGR